MNYNCITIKKKITVAGWKCVYYTETNSLFRKSGYPDPVIIPNHSDEELPLAVVQNLERITGLSLRR